MNEKSSVRVPREGANPTGPPAVAREGLAAARAALKAAKKATVW